MQCLYGKPRQKHYSKNPLKEALKVDEIDILITPIIIYCCIMAVIGAIATTI